MTSKSTSLTLLETRNFNRWAAKNPDQLLWNLGFEGIIAYRSQYGSPCITDVYKLYTNPSIRERASII